MMMTTTTTTTMTIMIMIMIMIGKKKQRWKSKKKKKKKTNNKIEYNFYDFCLYSSILLLCYAMLYCRPTVLYSYN